MMMGRLTAVIDGQWGSTGKGNIVAKIANEYDCHVRVGAPNAGHSYMWNGKKFVRQIIPVGHINPDATLIIGRGALINERLLRKEIEELSALDSTIVERLYVDARAGMLSPWHEEAEGHTSGEIHQRIGSTGEGVGAARVARINRKRGEGYFQLFEDIAKDDDLLRNILVHNTPLSIRNFLNGENNVLLEGSQGSGLDLIHGTWPYCTSTGCGVAQLLADVGVAPRFLTDTVLVLRTYPIRVAGNSGPLCGEISWEELSQRVGKEVSERTTVTKKIRRVAEWDWGVVMDAITLNAPTSLAINFLDYKFPEDEGKSDWADLSNEAKHYISDMETIAGVFVKYIGTGGPNYEVIVR